MIRLIAAALLTLAVAACNQGSSRPTLPPQYQPPAANSGWVFQASPGMPGAPAASGDGFWFNFPVGPESPGAASVHYVVRPGVRLGSSLALAFRIEGSEPVFQYKLNPDNTCGGEANVSLYLQRRGDDWSGQGAMASFRWWSRDAAVLKLGDGTLVVPLEVGSWINVWGQSNDASGFALALRDLQAVGVTFGGGCFKGHGVNLRSGSARFIMQTFG